MQIYPSWFFLPLLSPFNLEKRNEITVLPKCMVFIRAHCDSRYRASSTSAPSSNKRDFLKETAQIATKSRYQILFPSWSRIRRACHVPRDSWLLNWLAKVTWRELPAPGHASSFTIGLTTIETWQRHAW